ncbi:serine/threonine-protein kinase [Peristeroidobacter soli]|uniref:serine/threonine-protein kinase n=1 Tax=Peristeroidobacter soli TaxID=2497877 RepID=UPI00101D70C7|nr:serine/threonine-protein kinase [Peristeroidobacter soli]
MLERGQELSADLMLVRRLGTGGTGEVWLAQERERRGPVAVKILSVELARNEAIRAALHDEYARIAALGHPNILRVDGLQRSARHAWIAMDYAAGGDLTQLRGRGCAEILRATIPIASALATAHAAGLVHRDVKPANVLLSTDGVPLLTDFGALTRGSPFSASPQQLAGARASVADDMYGFGALLYELLSGYPPFYPDAAAASDVAREPAALPPHVPARVAQLVARLLARRAEDRPTDMGNVERDLRAALASLAPPAMISDMNEPAHIKSASVKIEPPGMRPPPGQGETLRSEWQRTTGPRVSEDDLRRQGFRRGLGASLVALGLVAVGVVFFVLPKVMEREQPVQKTPTAAVVAPPKTEEPPAEKKELDFAALAKAKQAAEELRGAIDERLQKLNERAVAQWGGEELGRANSLLAAADQDVTAREYTAAEQKLNEISPLLDALEKRAPRVLAEQLKAGAQALTDGRSEDAKAAFTLALKLEPTNQVASRGLKRAGTLDQVLALLTKAEGLEKDGNATAALDSFHKALALDAEATRASEGIARITSRQASDAFASAMARGYSALAATNYSQAREAFEAARRIRPDAPEIPQALRQIEQEQRTGVIGVKLQQAQQLESQEKWSEALKEYRSVLDLDTTVAAANDGVARTSPRAALNEQLEMYLTQPERLFSQSVRVVAKETLARASGIANPGPILSRQIKTLGEWLARADVPVPVSLRSDNITQVTIYRVGALGAFEQRSLDLVPGSYTLVGTRPGYRDVRREISVMPGAAPAPVEIRCEDKI